MIFFAYIYDYGGVVVKKKVLFIPIFLCVAVILSVVFFGHSLSGNTNNYDIGVDRAKEIALYHAGILESDVSFTKAELYIDDGIYEYDIEFLRGRTKYEYAIDPVSGKILDHDTDYD